MSLCPSCLCPAGRLLLLPPGPSASGVTPPLRSVSCHCCSAGSAPPITQSRLRSLPSKPCATHFCALPSDTLFREDSVLPSGSSPATHCLLRCSPVTVLRVPRKLDFPGSLVTPHAVCVAASGLPRAPPRASPCARGPRLCPGFCFLLMVLLGLPLTSSQLLGAETCKAQVCRRRCGSSSLGLIGLR